MFTSLTEATAPIIWFKLQKNLFSLTLFFMLAVLGIPFDGAEDWRDAQLCMFMLMVSSIQ